MTKATYAFNLTHSEKTGDNSIIFCGEGSFLKICCCPLHLCQLSHI